MSDGSATPSELERQIEAARVDLARSVDAIVDRVHPKRVIARTVGRVRERVGLMPAHRDGVVGELPPGQSAQQRGGLPVRKEYLIAAGAVVAAGTVAAAVIWYRRRS
ncbi:MAG: DUF3618 domain-containing protein [Streptosporangiales bacterium]|nr:DUF3618 domain-containing protein [Streptosporangiales bacterium]MBO0889441.1 DUF3618 domain-containing protein [Acidothermales bacterium]